MFDIEVTGNLIEAGVWGVVSLLLAVRYFRVDQKLRQVYAILASAFFFFGISDIIESQTGAWWEPWWLFVLKGACVLAFAYAFREYFHIRKKMNEEDFTRRQEAGEDVESQ